MYFSELRINWHALLSGAIGMALGSALSHYTLSLFGPALIADLGWSKAQFALIGSVPLATMVLIPVAGRFVDSFGPRIAAIVGFTAVPLGFVAMSLMSGNLIEYFAIYLAQHVFGILTTSMVFCRVIVERFDAARGIALSLIMSAPPLAGAIAAPILAGVIGADGWRAGYLAMAAITATGGVIAIALMGRGRRRSEPRPAVVRLSRPEFMALLRNPVLLLLIGGMVLVNLPQAFAQSQLKLIAIDNGVSDGSATAMVSLYAIGVIIGRFLTGLALDSKVRPHLVAIVALGLPAVGYALFASGTGVVAVLMGGVLLVGLAQGAESDVGAYLLSRRFDIKNFSLLLSFLTMSIGIGSALGSLVLSYTLYLTDSYTPFLVLAAAGSLAGALAFGLTGARRWRVDEPREAADTILEQAIAGELS
jgi:MFS family permease